MLIIEKQKINNLIGELAKKTPVYIPMRREQNGAVESFFKEFEPGNPPAGGIDFNYLPTTRSIKEFFLPAKEDIFVVEKNRLREFRSPKKFVLFGLNHHDLEALTQLDEIMAKPKEDYFYFSKRKAAIVIGLINESIKNPPGGDFVLMRINENQYEAISLTEKGRILAKNKIFKKEPAVIASAGAKSLEIMPQLKQLLLDPELLADSVLWSWKHDLAVWDELAVLCLGCGICTYVCPLCYCFSIEDKIELDGKTCEHCRQWDSCTLPRFSQISGALPDGRQGFNFHKTIKERYYNWYFHKFVRAYKEYGKSQCVACGRCQKYCPAKIDIEKYLIKIVENYKKALPQ
jgi:sulfhydrogenase subunit beta (sulfur reductase)